MAARRERREKYDINDDNNLPVPLYNDIHESIQEIVESQRRFADESIRGANSIIADFQSRGITMAGPNRKNYNKYKRWRQLIRLWFDDLMMWAVHESSKLTTIRDAERQILALLGVEQDHGASADGYFVVVDRTNKNPLFIPVEFTNRDIDSIFEGILIPNFDSDALNNFRDMDYNIIQIHQGVINDYDFSDEEVSRNIRKFYVNLFRAQVIASVVMSVQEPVPPFPREPKLEGVTPLGRETIMSGPRRDGGKFRQPRGDSHVAIGSTVGGPASRQGGEMGNRPSGWPGYGGGLEMDETGKSDYELYMMYKARYLAAKAARK
jgi:hypothetical protein